MSLLAVVNKQGNVVPHSEGDPAGWDFGKSCTI